MTDIANEEHRVILMKQGVKAWNAWRFKPEGFALDLAGADLALAARQTPAIPHDEFGHRTMNVVSPGRGSPPGRLPHVAKSRITGE